MSNSGVIYDEAALGRIQGWVDQQTEVFTEAENERKQKEWAVIIAASIVTAVVLIVVVKIKTK